MADTHAFVPLQPSPVERLRDPEVEKFFLGVLQSEIPAEKKYQKFVQFFELDASLSREIASRGHELAVGADPSKVEEVLAKAAESAGMWQPQQILRDTEDCLRRAVRRLQVSQHSDGGWGFEPEISRIWATVHGVLALHMAESQGVAEDPVWDAYTRALDWLMAHRADWSLEDIPPLEERSVYELSAVIRCLHETGRIRDPDVAAVVAVCIDRIAGAQNADGGWDRSLWGPAWPSPTRIWSETGGTSFALQALAIAGGDEYVEVIVRGLNRLVGAQNSDGSWSVMITAQLDRGARTVTKTCDALKGVLACRRTGIDMTPYEPAITKGMEYLHSREQPFFDEEKITGWGWDWDELSALENTCHTLEVLLQVENASLPLLTANASWLIRMQHNAPGSLEDGKWAGGETERIALSLLHFYEAIKASPLFASATGSG